MIELFLNHWMSSSHSISHWINYVRILTCSSLMLQLLKTTCCLNSSLATLAWIPSNLWHHTHSIIKSLVVLCLLACLLFFLKGVLCWKMHTKVVQMLFVSEQGFRSSYLWLQMFILMGYCAILAVWTSVALYVCSQWCQHIVFRYIILSPIALLLVTGGAKNVTPVGAETLFSPRSARRLGAKRRRRGRWAVGGSGARFHALRQRARLGQHNMHWEFILP